MCRSVAARDRRVSGSECFGDELGVFGARRVVQVLHGGLDVGVAHPFLDATDVGFADHPGAEGVAKVVEAQLAQPGALEGGDVAAVQGGRVEVAAGYADEDLVVVTGEVLARASRASASATSGPSGPAHPPDFGVVNAPPE